MTRGDLPLQGYASLFGEPDLGGDIVRAGAFAGALRRRPRLPMFIRHDPRLRAGWWTKAEEDSRGLFVQGEIDPDAPAAGLARRLIAAGVDGLSIGFNALRARRTREGRRELLEIELWEVSIVAAPMCPRARLSRPTQSFQAA